MAPAIAMGNRVVLVPSAPFPLAATDLYQVLDTSDLPGGVVNIVTGMAGDLAPTLASHADIDAIWTFSPDVDQGEIEYLSAGNLKRCWSASGQLPDIGTAQAKIFLDHATEVKTIWLPYGA
jgi:aldehyde dehydrogenase (NAD+)